MKRKLSIILVLAMMCTLMAGCMAEEVNLKFNSDGSGEMGVGMYLSAEFIESMGAKPEDIFTDDEGKPMEVETKHYNGAKYYGVHETQNFKSLSELSSYFEEASEDEVLSMTFNETIQNGKRVVAISGIIPSNETITSDSGASMEELEALGTDIANMLIVTMDITFPDGVLMIDGISKDAYRIEGNKVHIDMTSDIESQYYYITGSLGNASAVSGKNNFVKVNDYTKQFTDVENGAWYEESLGRMFESGITAGTSATTFSPYDKLSLAQIITLGSRVHAIYNGCADTAFVNNPGNYWFSSYVMYAYQTGIIEPGIFNEKSDMSVLNRPATRAEMAYVVARCLPESEYKTDIVYNGFADVSADNIYAPYIETLYKAGITVGTSETTFSPDQLLNRCQAIVFLDRLINN